VSKTQASSLHSATHNLEHQYQSGVSDLSAAMRRHAWEGNIQAALHSFNELRKDGLHLNSGIYNTMLRAWICCGNLAAAEHWLEDMKNAGMADCVSYNMLIEVSVRCHELNRARALMQEMEGIGIRCSVATFNLLLHGYAQDSLFMDGINLLEEMHAAGVKYNTSTKDALVRLLNSARSLGEGFDRACQILCNYDVVHFTRNPSVAHEHFNESRAGAGFEDVRGRSRKLAASTAEACGSNSALK
jgi:pentatricopeptide repeat protein